MITPCTPLKPGTRIAVVSPGGMVPDRFKKQVGWGIDHLSELGFQPIITYLTQDEVFDPKRTAQAFMDAFADPEVDAILPACGGPHTYEILRYLDFQKLSTSGKLFCGMSDLSPLVSLLATHSSLSFYGTHLNFLHPKSSAPCNTYTIQSFWNMLCATEGGKKKLDRNEKIHLFEYHPGQHQVLSNIYAKTEYITKAEYRDVIFTTLKNQKTSWEGVLFAFTLRSIRLMIEQGISFDFKGTILLLDALGQTHADILEDLSYISTHTNIAESSLVYFSSFAERSDMERQLPELVDSAAIQSFLMKAQEIIGTENVLYGFPAGHCQYRLTIPLGVQAKVSASDGSIEILEQFFI